MEREISANRSSATAPPLSNKFISFADLKPDRRDVGGKAYALAMLSQAGFPVPAGIILTENPSSPETWQQLTEWWQKQNKPPLAIRSSFQAEDSGDLSFAGQNKTFLNVTALDNLKSSITKCFQSVNEDNTKAYQEHFKVDNSDARMNVIIQVMVEPKYAGVFFSENPKGGGWIFEFIEGLGEDLVSGHKTPYQVTQKRTPKLPDDWKPEFQQDIIRYGFKAKEFLKYKVDMEWAIDHKGTFYALQARPITTKNTQDAPTNRFVIKELKRLRRYNAPSTVWDGQTFAEWTGFPSYLTFSLWKDAFGPNHAFGNALQKIGYLAYDSSLSLKSDSILERVFGHVYVNLDKLNKLYFGPIPYSVKTTPRPHLKFDFKKLNFKSFLTAPYLMYRMAKVSWNLSTSRSKWLSECRRELLSFKQKLKCPSDPNFYSTFSDEDLRDAFLKNTNTFSRETLYWPIVLIIMVEASMASLNALLKSVVGKEESGKLIQTWLTKGINTCTYSMNQNFHQALSDLNHRPFFLSRYGHRGPGELDLAHERWQELGSGAFFKTTKSVNISTRTKSSGIEQEINALKTIKKELILKEWRQLKEMLEMREQWKMELLKPYAEIRYQALEIGKRNGLGKDIFWARLSEIAKHRDSTSTKFSSDMEAKISDRKKRFKTFRGYSFPNSFSLNQIEKYLTDDQDSSCVYFEGQGISPGAAYGTVQVVTDYSEIDMESWPEDAILVAEATDPGWTPLFLKSKAVVVEKGGVLSHCAIVAREMNIPAVTGINKCHHRLKTGMKIWVDGNKGRVYHG